MPLLRMLVVNRTEFHGGRAFTLEPRVKNHETQERKLRFREEILCWIDALVTSEWSGDPDGADVSMLTKRQFFLIACLFFAIAIGGVALFMDHLQRQAFEAEARTRADLVSGFGKACRSYTKEKLRPAVQKHTDAMIFEAMSSTYVTRGVFESLNKKMVHYCYRQATLNPLNSCNKANEYEAALIANFKQNPDLEESTGYHFVNGEEQFYVAQPTVVEQKCLQCHSSPEEAPAAIVQRYGRTHGYGWKIGETVSALIVSVPTRDLRAQYASIQSAVLATFAVLAISLISMSYFFFAKVHNRTSDLEISQNKLSRNESRLKAMMASSLDPLITIDIRGIVQSASDTVETVFGWKPHELIGQNVKILVPEPYRSEHDGYLAKYQHTKETHILGNSRDVTAVRRNGEVFPCLLTVWQVDFADQSEPLFMGTIRDTTKRKQNEEALRVSEQTNRLLKHIAIAANEASGPSEALQVAVKRICDYKDWPIGHVYFVDPEGSPDLVPSDIWHLADEDRHQAMVDVTGKTTFAPGVGLPGRVALSKAPMWIEDVSTDDNFPRAKVGPDIHIHSAFAFPILADQEVVAVLEFFSEETVPRDELLLDVASRVGLQLGIAVERHRDQQKIQEMQATLLETARQAGKAEIATSVLHNVGNVLNSVNVSAGLIQDKIHQSGVGNLTKAVNIMKQHLGSIGDYVTQDERGKHFPKFLIDLNQHMAEEEVAILNEVHSLISNIDHVKAIVAAQQTYAKNMSAVIEPVSLAELLEDAVQINLSSMQRHSVEIVRQFDEIELVTADKQKILQIVVNLISNAKYACMESGHEEHQIQLCLRDEGEGYVSIEVQDNGMGIAGENLASIFAYGFTTRQEGHGFGLHSSALAAKELGGSLVAHSEGPGAGATFTLKLPRQGAGVSICSK